MCWVNGGLFKLNMSVGKKARNDQDSVSTLGPHSL